MKRLEQELALVKLENQKQEAMLKQLLEESEVKEQFRRSLTGTHPTLYYEITAVRKMASPPSHLLAQYKSFVAGLPADLARPELARRIVFHTCSTEAVVKIEQEGMRPAACPVCLDSAGLWVEHDCGWFGDHSMGVYASKHADYTFWYQHKRNPVGGDEGTVLLLELVTGKVKLFDCKLQGAKPTERYLFPAFSFLLFCSTF